MFSRRNASATAAPDPPLLKLLRQHFDGDPAQLQIVEQQFAIYERPNLHLALEETLAGPGKNAEQIGVLVLEQFREARLAELTRAASAKSFDVGPVKYADVPLAGGRQLACVKRALYLFRDDGRPVALLLGESGFSHVPAINVEVMAADRPLAETCLRRLTGQVRHGKAFRGEVLSVEGDCLGNLSIRFHQLPKIGRDDIILPEALLRRIERHTLSFTRHADKLRAAGPSQSKQENRTSRLPYPDVIPFWPTPAATASSGCGCGKNHLTNRRNFAHEP